jgi:division protein CdvB (Snf7/Vps24/ESCRT-III family)
MPQRLANIIRRRIQDMSDSLISRLEGRLGIHQQPLKERIMHVMYRLRVQRNKIESMGLMMQHRDKELFDKCVTARASGDMTRASLYAEECADVRKIAKVVLQSELALERVLFKLETAEMLGDMVYLMHPIKSVVTSIGEQMRHVMPEVSYELSQINETLDGLVVDTGSVAETFSSPVAQSGEAESILKEADTLAEQRIKTRFPELQTPTPTTLPA